MHNKVHIFIKDLDSDKFPDDAIEKMFFDLWVVYSVTKEDLSLAFNSIIRLRPMLGYAINDKMKEKFDEAYRNQIQLQAANNLRIDPNKLSRKY